MLVASLEQGAPAESAANQPGKRTWQAAAACLTAGDWRLVELGIERDTPFLDSITTP